MADLAWLNQAPQAEAAAALFRCCGCAGWARAVSEARPFGSEAALLEAAEREWSRASREDVLEAFSHHPRIGDREALKARFPGTHAWSAGEQSAAAATADESVIDDLAEANRAYERKFDHIFIVCATGKTASEILSLVRERLGNDPDTELSVAAGEQMKITKLRLGKLLAETHAEAPR
jgi:2-oxo-4-hydroxy-4-carboxy-5-ureidoimidazoline decarboxylase